MPKVWQNNDIVWSEGVEQMDLVIKDVKGTKAHTRPDLEKFFPTKVRMTLIQVSTGAKYDPKLVPNLPEAGEKKQAGIRVSRLRLLVFGLVGSVARDRLAQRLPAPSTCNQLGNHSRS